MSELVYVDKNCPACGKHFNAGRRDKKFCSTRCKNDFHNQRNRPKRREVDQGLVALRRNERILHAFFEGDPLKWGSIPFTLLQFRGYDFDVEQSEVEDPATGRLVRYHGFFGLSINADLSTFCLHMIDERGSVIL
ncbi:MAG: hypothetical protein EOO15_20675 [Chitinophagaceae bacterium]|nr:MAG: hypothetical protein EOO15_20675 [Chitinophagaceae bacterium]